MNDVLQRTKNKYHLKSRVVFESFEDGGLVLRLEDHRLFEINKSADIILTYSDGSHTVDEIADIFVTEFQISKESALADVNELIKKIYDLHLIQSVDVGGNGGEEL
jgi:hypothetical protein